MNFCVNCGAPLLERGERAHGGLHWVCSNPACGRAHYRNAKPCAGVLVEQNGAVLLVRRNIAPFVGAWDIPGGYLHEWEHPAEGARREVYEETGLEVELTRLLGIFIDCYGSEGANTFNVYYRGRPLGGTLAPADDAAETCWFRPDALPTEIAFPGHIPDVLRLWRVAQAAEPLPAPVNEPALVVHVSRDVAAQFGDGGSILPGAE